MELSQILSALTFLGILCVSYILRNQVKAQNDILNKYKDLVALYDSVPNVKALFELEKEQIKSTMSFDNEILKTQMIELATTIHYAFIVFEMQHTNVGKDFSRDRVISTQMPHCKKLMEEIAAQLDHNSKNESAAINAK